MLLSLIGGSNRGIVIHAPVDNNSVPGVGRLGYWLLCSEDTKCPVKHLLPPMGGATSVYQKLLHEMLKEGLRALYTLYNSIGLIKPLLPHEVSWLCATMAEWLKHSALDTKVMGSSLGRPMEVSSVIFKFVSSAWKVARQQKRKLQQKGVTKKQKRTSKVIRLT